MNPGTHRWSEWSIRGYRILLRIYPRGFRNEYGTRLDQAFRDLVRDEVSHGFFGLIRLSMRVLPDFVSSVISEYAGKVRDGLQSSSGMVFLFAAAVTGLPILFLGGAGFFLIASLFASASAIIFSLVLYTSGQRRRALRIFGWVGVCTIVYFGALILVPLSSSPEVVDIGKTYCPDILCVAVADVRKTQMSPELSYRVALHVWSVANRTPKTLNGYSVWLIDRLGRRFSPVNEPSAYPFSFVLKPGESVTVPLTFQIPADAQELFLTGDTDRVGLVNFMIGSGRLVHKPDVLFRIQE